MISIADQRFIRSGLSLLLLLTVILTGCSEEVVEKETLRPVKVFKAGDLADARSRVVQKQMRKWTWALR